METAKRPDTKCSCGKNKKIPENKSCLVKEIADHAAENVGALNCANSDGTRYTGNVPKRGCMCGITMKNKEPAYNSCKDGSRKSRCPCFTAGVGCTDCCRCFNFKNMKSVHLELVAFEGGWEWVAWLNQTNRTLYVCSWSRPRQLYASTSVWRPF